MAIYKTSDAVGEREDLSDVISRIDSDETPIFSNAKKEVTKGVTHDWQVQELTASASNNYAAEGEECSFSNPTATTRPITVHQVSIQATSVSGTLDAVDVTGREREAA